MKYAIQWIDDGGDFDLDVCDEDLSRALNRLNLTMDNVIEYGGVLLVGSKYEGEPEHYWYIETDVELPEWVGWVNLRGNMDRFDEVHSLWFYTFEIDETSVERWYTVSEYDEFKSERV